MEACERQATKLLNHIRVQEPLHPGVQQWLYWVNETPMTYAEGVVENIIRDQYNIISLVHSASILGGASGSGLFNSRGELVGINTATYKSLTNAVDLTEIQYFLYGKVR